MEPILNLQMSAEGLEMVILLKYGFCKNLLLSECNSDQLNISWPFLSSLLSGFAIALLLHPPKSDDKKGQETFNWSELHSERSKFLQNRDFIKISFHFLSQFFMVHSK